MMSAKDAKSRYLKGEISIVVESGSKILKGQYITKINMVYCELSLLCSLFIEMLLRLSHFLQYSFQNLG